MSRIAKGIAASVSAAVVFGAGYGAAQLSTPREPRPCYVMNGDQGPETGTAAQHNAVMPSGDAGRFNDGLERVCTDGTLVPVQGYGQ